MLERVGVYCLGLFVGYLLALGLAHSKPTLRLVLTVLGAAVGGVPIAFLAQAGSKWVYPIGLLFGFLFFRLISAHAYLFTESKGGSEETPLRNRRTRVELALISGSLVFLTALALLLPSHLTVTESGEIKLGENVGKLRIQYSRPFQNVPRLSIKPDGYATYRIEDERPDGFVFVPQGYTVGSSVSWKATGEERSPSQ